MHFYGLFGLVDWWAGLDWRVRVVIPLVLILISTLIFFLADRLWIWGWALGGVLLLAGGRSESEKQGYRF